MSAVYLYAFCLCRQLAYKMLPVLRNYLKRLHFFFLRTFHYCQSKTFLTKLMHYVYEQEDNIRYRFLPKLTYRFTATPAKIFQHLIF